MTNKTSGHFYNSRVKIIAGFAVSFWRTILWVMVIFILSFLPGRVFEKVKLFEKITFQDLIVHFIMYAVFTVFLIKELSSVKSEHLLNKAGWITPLLGSVVLGIFTELVQHFLIPGRTGSLSDFALDMCGSAAVILFCRIPPVRTKFKL
jgi:hypothetical protein